MYCPNCNHQQGVEDKKFCSRCGFSLEIVSVLLGNHGIVPELGLLREAGEKIKKRIGVLFSLSCWLIVTFLVNLISSIRGGSENEIIIATLGLALGVFIAVVSVSIWRLTPKREMAGEPSTPVSFVNMQDNRPELFASPDYVGPEQFRGAETADLVQRPGVTDETTKFLNDNN
jgi:hypothetical protein